MIDSETAMRMWRDGANDYEIAMALGKEPQQINAWRHRRGLAANAKPGGGKKKRGISAAGPAEQEKKPAKPVYANTAACQRCAYWEVVTSNDNGFTGFCQYILMEWRKRPCPPGKGCTVRRVNADRDRERRTAEWEGGTVIEAEGADQFVG